MAAGNKSRKQKRCKKRNAKAKINAALFKYSAAYCLIIFILAGDYYFIPAPFLFFTFLFTPAYIILFYCRPRPLCLFIFLSFIFPLFFFLFQWAGVRSKMKIKM